MQLAFCVSTRSLDPHTKHGCVIVDNRKQILSTGYNSPHGGADDSKVPLTRPEKYDFMLHSESNAIIAAARNGTRLDGSTIYITGHPCHKCLSEIINAGIVEIVYGPVQAKSLKWDIIKHKLSDNIIKTREYTNIDFLIKNNLWNPQ